MVLKLVADVSITYLRVAGTNLLLKVFTTAGNFTKNIFIKSMRKARVISMSDICNKDCFNCPYEDCINDEFDDNDFRELKKLDKELGEMNTTTGYEYDQYRKKKRQYYQTHKEERKAYQRSYYQTHKEERKEERRAYNRKCYQTHKEERKAYQRSYYQAHKEEHKEKCKVYQRNHYQEHKEERRAYGREYMQTPRGNYKKMTIEQVETLFERWRAGATMKELALEMGYTHYSQIKRWFNKYGFKFDGRKRWVISND